MRNADDVFVAENLAFPFGASRSGPSVINQVVAGYTEKRDRSRRLQFAAAISSAC